MNTRDALHTAPRSSPSCAILGLLASVALSCAGLRAEDLSALPLYQAPAGANRDVFGEIRTWGNGNLMGLWRLWELGFHDRHQNGIHYSDVMSSGGVTIGGLYCGVADIGIPGHRIWPIERRAFKRVFGYEPTEVVIGTGSYDVVKYTPGNVIFVNAANPLTHLTLKQLDGILGNQRTGGYKGLRWAKESARGPEANLRTWGQLGLTGEWAGRQIHLYGYDLTGTGFSIMMQQEVFGGGDTWNPTLDERPLGELNVVGPHRGGNATLDLLSKDPGGIGYCAISYWTPDSGTKHLALAATEGGPYIEPTRENFFNHTYPLTEGLYLYINRAPGKPIDPKVKEFLRYVLSREGQQSILDDGSYLPLTAKAAEAELGKLN